jgi:hypothetical protein
MRIIIAKGEGCCGIKNQVSRLCCVYGCLIIVISDLVELGVKSLLIL